MKIKLGILFLAVMLFAGCQNNKIDNSGQSDSNVVLYEGAVELADKKFGLYYGDRNGDEIGVYYVVLSDAIFTFDR